MRSRSPAHEKLSRSNTSSRMRGDSVMKEKTCDLSFETDSTSILLQCILEDLHCSLSQSVRGREIRSARQMSDTITANEHCKLFADKGEVLLSDTITSGSP